VALVAMEDAPDRTVEISPPTTEVALEAIEDA
jgi:hypothetical protein